MNLLDGILKTLTDHHPRIKDEETQINSRLLSILLLIFIPLTVVVLIVLSVAYRETQTALSPDFLVFGPFIIALCGFYWINRSGYFHITLNAVLVLAGVAILSETILDNDFRDLAFLLLPMVVAVVLLSRAYLIALGIFYVAEAVFALLVFPEIPSIAIIMFVFIILTLGIGLNIISRIHRDYLEGIRKTKLMASELRYSLSADAVNDGLWDWDFTTNRVFYSSRWKEMIGYQPEEITDSPDEWLSRIHPDDQEQVGLQLAQLRLFGAITSFEEEYRFRHKNGEYIWVLSRGRPSYDDTHALVRSIGSHTDITARKQAEDKLSFGALHDNLTGLANRALFNEKVNQVVKYVKKDASFLFAVLFIDLDNFKDVNDSMGHVAGDEVLKQFASLMQSVLFDVDTLARLGGDEFVILLDSLDAPQRAIDVVRRIKDILKEPINIHNNNIYLTFSVGVVIGTPEYTLSEEILRDADIAMYHAKSNGKDTFEIFNTEMRDQILNRISLERELRQAIQNQEFFLEYQPITELNSSRLIGFEALLRWRHPNKGLIPPAGFIAVAEQTGLITDVTQSGEQAALD